ncbi:MAG: CRISPR-associated helicase Cas3' [Oscillospiraceae bacterium]|jgi:CRISPR-associated helicase Cas3/CRISPR-associated endonuclease Cas3-HD|nr:CRISPR-associated helicase Cas3' [Oscillospiraceae bacterium]
MAIAHLRAADGAEQSVLEHLQGTAALARQFAQAFGGEDLAQFCGMLHDLGKYSAKFQRRIREGGNKTDHATAGAQESNARLRGFGWLAAYCIAGHHGGLPNGGLENADKADASTLVGRLHKQVQPYGAYAEAFDPQAFLPKQYPPLRPLGKQGFTLAFFTRMLYSCLVDADFLDTEGFMQPDRKRAAGTAIAVLEQKIDEKIATFAAPDNHLNRLRTDILHNCVKKSAQPPGLFTLTVPTGGGKTISSLAFALKHARRHGMQRVIYVIPYHSIIEQNAAVFKEILGTENVLEHHAGFDYEKLEDDDLKAQQYLATENWDMPVVVTTTVQFFESLFAHKSSRCRKLHNIANSVVIFDEAQMLPLPYLLPCVRAVMELVQNYRTTCVLCSATQPAIGPYFKEIGAAQEICENTQALYQAFKKTEIRQIGLCEDAELAARLAAQTQVLCIVNTRKHAQALFAMLPKEEGCFHLSTLLYPAHRSKLIQDIKARLRDKKPCRVVSTSLVEAGVDLDFPVVYRAQAGVDSQVQAAGRCNREGKLEGNGRVYTYQPEAQYRSRRAAVRRPTEVAEDIAARFPDVSAPEAITAYFEALYALAGEETLDQKHVVRRFEEGIKAEGGRQPSFPFAEIGAEFQLIESNTFAVVIPVPGDNDALLAQLRAGYRSRDLMRKIQQYTVSVYDWEYKELARSGTVERLDEAVTVLACAAQYHAQTGLLVRFEGGDALFA